MDVYGSIMVAISSVELNRHHFSLRPHWGCYQARVIGAQLHFAGHPTGEVTNSSSFFPGHELSTGTNREDVEYVIFFKGYPCLFPEFLMFGEPQKFWKIRIHTSRIVKHGG